MALVVETGAVVSGANTFIDVAYVDSYCDLVGSDRSTWDSITTEQREAAIVRAARHHEARYGQEYYGYRKQKNQPMSWPRHNVPGLDGHLVASDTVPDRVKWAQAELALRTAGGTLLLVDVSPESTASLTMKKRKVGDLETEDRYESSSSNQVQYRYVDELLEPFLIGGYGNVLIERG